MKPLWLLSRTFRILVVPLVMAGALIGAVPGGASASTCVSWTGTQPANPSSSSNFLTSVAVRSSCNAWAVGAYNNGTAYQTLIEHWNGSAWRQVPSPNPGGSSRPHSLTSVRALSATNIWAVGHYNNGTGYRTLIEHWNGSAWSQVASPNPSSASNFLYGLRAISASNIWAVGVYYNGAVAQTLILHWNGTAWKHVSSPNPSTIYNVLSAVAAVSSSNVWAVGSYFNGTAFQTLILHWNGTAWKRVPSPNPGGSANPNALNGVAAVTSSNIWAVGYFSNGATYQTLIVHWNGTAWKRVSSPNASATVNILNGVSAISSSNVWAVGYFSNGTTYQTLIVHWNGTAWKRVPSPNPGGSSHSNILDGIGASSKSNVWAVGEYSNGSATLTLALHCC